jgi:hypothetical protein
MRPTLFIVPTEKRVLGPAVPRARALKFPVRFLRFAAADLGERRLAGVVQILETVEALAAVPITLQACDTSRAASPVPAGPPSRG